MTITLPDGSRKEYPAGSRPIDVARSLGAPFLIAPCGASEETLLRRLAARAASASDASDADAAVLAHQKATAERFAADEAGDVLAIDTSSDAALRLGLDRAVARLMELRSARHG